MVREKLWHQKIDHFICSELHTGAPKTTQKHAGTCNHSIQHQKNPKTVVLEHLTSLAAKQTARQRKHKLKLLIFSFVAPTKLRILEK